MLPQGWLQNRRPLGQVRFPALEQITTWNVEESQEDMYRYHLPADSLSKVARIGAVLESRRYGKAWKQRDWGTTYNLGGNQCYQFLVEASTASKVGCAF